MSLMKHVYIVYLIVYMVKVPILGALTLSSTNVGA